MKRVSQWIREATRQLAGRPIQNMLSLSFTLVALLGMTFLGTALYFRFSVATQAMAEEEGRRVVSLVGLSLDAYLRNMMRVSDAMYFRVIKNADLARDSIHKEVSLLYETNRDFLVSISLLDSEGALLASAPLSKLKENAQPDQQEWFVRATEQIENLHFSAPHVQNLFADPDYRYRWVVSLSRSVELTADGATSHGVLLVDMNFSGIEQIFKSVNYGENGYMYLCDENGEIIYHPRQQLLYSNLAAESNLETAQLEDGSHRENFGGEQRSITVKTVGYTGWKIVGVSPVAGMTDDYYSLQSFAALVLLFTLFLMAFANLFVSSRIADPIKALERSVKRLEDGDWEAPIAVGGSYEIVHLGNTIRSMVEQMRRLMDDIVAQQESKRKSELEALQAQINPHFLYNTLDSIIWMIENERYPEAISMVTALARLFRISLSKGRTIIPLRDELEHAKNYMTIQQMRYKNKFEVTFQGEEPALDMATVKLVIQPILENAIYHGMEYMDGDGEILVRAFLQGNDLCVEVTDNGNGMSPEVRETLLTNHPHVRSKGSGIGLRNVHERIRLAFGEGYGLEIESEPDEGATVRIRLPQKPYATFAQEVENRAQ